MAKQEARETRESNPKQKADRKSSVVPSEKSGCTSSFLMNERNELDKKCGSAKLDDEYVQPDNEKEVGGEG